MTDNDRDARALDEIIRIGAGMTVADKRQFVHREIQRLFEQARIRVAAAENGTTTEEAATAPAGLVDVTPS